MRKHPTHSGLMRLIWGVNAILLTGASTILFACGEEEPEPYRDAQAWMGRREIGRWMVTDYGLGWTITLRGSLATPNLSFVCRNRRMGMAVLLDPKIVAATTEINVTFAIGRRQQTKRFAAAGRNLVSIVHEDGTEIGKLLARDETSALTVTANQHHWSYSIEGARTALAPLRAACKF